MYLNINATDVVKYTNKLEQLHKSALPVAIRGALNDMAFKMKKETMPRTAKALFVERTPNFFKANSRVDAAQGFDIKKMVATVGFVSSGLHNSATNYAVRDLEQQEHGGDIGGRSFKPLPDARIGKSGLKNVRANNRISKILDLQKGKSFMNADDSKGANKMQQFIKASIHAGIDGYVLGGKILFRVTSVKRIGRNTRFTKEKLFYYNKHGIAKIKSGTHFMQKSAEKVHIDVEKFYAQRAIAQIQRLSAA